MNFKKTIIYSLDEIPGVVKQLSELLNHCKVMTIIGPLGAGKTTMVQSLLRAQGIDEVIMSPTFTYVNAYKNQRGQTFYHFDLYRINSEAEFLSQGFEEYLYAGNSWALIEWPEVIAPLLTHDLCKITIGYCEELDKRVMTVECVDNHE